MKKQQNPIIDTLITQTRKGSQKAFEELLKIYEPLFGSLLQKFKVRDCDEDDMRQEMSVIFYNSIFSYEITQSEINFGLYAKICMTNALITQMRALKKRNGTLATVLPEEMAIENLQVEEDDPSVGVIREEEQVELNEKIRSLLSPFEFRVWELYVSGFSTTEMAEKLVKEEKAVDNAVFRIRKKLKSNFSK